MTIIAAFLSRVAALHRGYFLNSAIASSASTPPVISIGANFAVAGLTLGFLLWQLGFMTIGGEWFGMWQSKSWDGVPSAFRFVMVIMAVLIFVVLPDGEAEAARS